MGSPETVETIAPPSQASKAAGIFRAALRVVGVAALLGILVTVLYGQAHPLDAGTPAPKVNAKGLDGALFDANAALRGGGVTVVNIWGTWCPPCREELPALARSAHKYEGKARFVGFAVQSSNAEIARLVDRMQIPYDIAHIDDATADAWNASSVPDTYIVDGNGVVQWSVRGEVDEKLLDQKLAPLLSR